MFKERYSGVWVRLSYVPCCSGCSTFILHTPLLSSSSSSYLPPPPTPPHRRLLPYPPPLYLSNRIHFLFDLFQFYVELCFILAWLAFYIYSTHPYSRLFFFFSRSRRSSSVSIKTATVGAPALSPFPCTLVIYLRSLISRKSEQTVASDQRKILGTRYYTTIFFTHVFHIRWC